MSQSERIGQTAEEVSFRRREILESGGDAPSARARDTSVTKVASRFSPRGAMGQRYLASGVHLSMRLWEEAAGPEEPAAARDYETVGFVISGRAELRLEGQTLLLEPGDSWVVPRGSTHSYRILEALRAVEATTPPAGVHGRDDRVKAT